MTTKQMDAIDDARRPSDDRPGGCWFAYYTDWSGFVAFEHEIGALRHGVEHEMKVAWVPFGAGIRDHVRHRED